MSYMVHYKGKLNLIKENGMAIEELFLKELSSSRVDDYLTFKFDNSYIEDIGEMINFYCSEFLDSRYIVIDGNLFKDYPGNDLGESDVFNISKTDDKTFEYELQYYNGGCCHEEALEFAIKNAKIEF